MTTDVWLPWEASDLQGLPDASESGLTYRFWNGDEEYPADPADCVFYGVPYMIDPEICVRPLPSMTSLRVVQTQTAGVDHVLAAVEGLAPGVRLCNARGVHEASTAELALTLTLASLRGIPRFVEGQRVQEWRQGFYPALADKSVLIVGHGAIGSAIEDRLAGFECARVARVARSGRTTERGLVHPLAELPRLLSESDVVILSTPLTEATRGLVSADFLGHMKDGALLVNVARGPVVDTKALLAELETGRITAALDVTDPEPLPPGHPLWQAPGVLISPHVGGPTSAFAPRTRRLLAAQVNRYAAGEPLANVVLTTS
ncbi:2-hydroxyacid dehydrogenase [Streptomyces silvensis]|uniref:Dihydrofolate reductase n=1 Tax=Streptomyces silvensis TaxID=1765722 RepID=A0A0W7WWR7_9ACTN|nr:2-hydroxyacid dehydrogenase [Streptomyces silvensis]KUF14951.1 dihydrofolate reductase [Streptomyces silvensis]